MNDFMSKGDIVGMLEDYDCFEVIGYLAEADSTRPCCLS